MAEKDGDLLIEVGDNAPGIPAEIQARLFEPFATYGKVQGTGRGLAIVRQVIEPHEGTITVKSTPGEATFRIRPPQPAVATLSNGESDTGQRDGSRRC